LLAAPCRAQRYSREPGNGEALAQAMYDVLTNSQLRESMVRNANEYVERHSWGRYKSGYLQLVDALIARRPDSTECIGAL